MAVFLYSGPSGDQYEKWKAEYLAIEEASKVVEAEVVEEAPAVVEAPKKTTAKK